VATATDGYQKLVDAGKINGMDNVSGTSTADDESRALVDHCVPDRASFFVALLARTEQFATQASLELFDGCFLKHGVCACCRGNP
jgi:hypothetical protein